MISFCFGSSSEGRESQINILSYTSFMNLHKTVNDTVRYEIKNTKDANGLPEIFEETVKAIAMVPFINEDVMKI